MEQAKGRKYFVTGQRVKKKTVGEKQDE